MSLSARKIEGSAGDADHERIGVVRNDYRVADRGSRRSSMRRSAMSERLAPKARLACSARNFVEPSAAARCARRLADGLADGTWDLRHGHLRRQPCLEGALVLVEARP